MKIIRIVIAIVLTLLLAALLLGSFLGPDSLKNCGGKPSTGDCAPADAIVVISGGDTSARTAEAIRLYKAGFATKIIVSGAAADPASPSNARVMQQQAVLAGVPQGDTMAEETSATTDENAANSMKLAKQNGYKSVILVTSAYHMRRALVEFQRNANGILVRAHPVATDKDWNSLWWLTPGGWVLALMELSKTVVTVLTGTIQH